MHIGSWLAAIACVSGAFADGEARGAPPATPGAVIVDGDLRLRRGDGARALAESRPPEPATGEIAFAALRGETLGFQVVIVAGDRPVDSATVTVSGLAGAKGGGSGGGPRASVFREHYLRVAARSRNDRRPAESLGWPPGARPPDDQMLGDVPDALLPIDVDPAPVARGPAVPARQTAAYWIDVDVPADAAAGSTRGAVQVIADGARLAELRIRVDVREPALPYRATSVFVFYEADRLEARLGDGPAVERQLWQLLHAHHIDALAPLRDAGDVTRLAAAYDGSLFSRAAGYDGPGPGVPPAVVALGAYGVLGAPGAGALARVDRMTALLPAALEDVFVYAIDESCASPRAGEWQRALAARPAGAGARARVGQTCSDPPERQATDIAMLPAAAYGRATGGGARAAGRRAWIYNGALPNTGTLLLDADPRGLIANGWIAAAAAIERWFYWESIFWDDDNAGGRGAIDPFATAETFHNRDGDTALGDGLLLYPGRQRGAFAGSSLGFTGVLPSLRLQALRRGIEDAGLIALAARRHPDETARIVGQAVPAMLDEARPDRPASWEGAATAFSGARAALRALIGPDDPPMTREQIRAAFADLSARRDASIARAPGRGGSRAAWAAVAGAAGAVLLAAALLGRAARRRSVRRRS